MNLKVTIQTKYMGPVQPPPDPPPGTNIPDEVIPPDCFEVFLKPSGEMSQLAGVMWHDPYPEYRSTKINETNEINPGRPIDSDGRVSPQGKTHCDLNGTTWWDAIVDLVGPRDAALIASRGDGVMDTNDDSVPLGDPYNPNPDKELKHMACHFAGDLVVVTGEIKQAGSTWYQVFALDYNNPPVKVSPSLFRRFLSFVLPGIEADNYWMINGERASWMTHPHYYWTRVNRRIVDPLTWITSNRVQSVTDAGVQGGKGDQHLFMMAKEPIAYRASQIGLYQLPMHLQVYAESVVVDGNLVPQSGGIEIWADALRFHGSDTYVRDEESGRWYLADEMLVRADADARAPGNLFDYRCYVSRIDSVGSVSPEPWMGKRGARNPVCGWQRKDFS